MSEKIIQLNEGVIKDELNELVRQSVEDTLNALLDEEADRLTNARRYERTSARKDTRARHYGNRARRRLGRLKSTRWLNAGWNIQQESSNLNFYFGSAGYDPIAGSQF